MDLYSCCLLLIGYIPRGGRGGGRMMNRSTSLSSSSNFTPSSTTNHGGRFSSNSTSSAIDDYTPGSASNPNEEDRVTPSFVRRASSFGDKPRGRGGGYAPLPMTSATAPSSSNYMTTSSHNSNTTTTTTTTTNDYYTMDGGGNSGGGRSSSATNIRGRGRGMNHNNNSTMASSSSRGGGGGGGGRGRFSSYSTSYGRSSPREDTTNNSSSSSRSYSWNRSNSYSNKFQDWSDNNNNNNNKHQQQYGSSSDDAPTYSSYRPPYRGGYQHYSSNNHHHHHSNNNNSSSRHLDSIKNDRSTSESFTSNTASTSINMESAYTSSAVDSTEQHTSWNHHHTASSPNHNENSIKSYHSSINTSGGNRSVDSEKRMLRSMPYSSYDHNTTTAKAFSYASLAESPPPMFGNTNGSTSSTAIPSTNGDVDSNVTTTTPAPAPATTANYCGPRWNTKSSFEQSTSYKKHPVHDNEPQDYSSFKWKRMKQEDDYSTNNNSYTSSKNNTTNRTPNNNLTDYNSTNVGETSNLDDKTELSQQQQEQQQPPQPKPIPSHTPSSVSSNHEPGITPLVSSQPTMVASKVESATPNGLVLPLSNVVREATDETGEKPEVLTVSETNSPPVDQTVGQAILKSEKIQESTELEQELKGSMMTTVGQTKAPSLEKAQETNPPEPVRKSSTAPASVTNVGGPMKSEKVQDIVTSQGPVRKGTMAFLRYMDALNTLEYTYVKYVLACKQEKKLQLHIQQLEKQPFTT